MAAAPDLGRHRPRHHARRRRGAGVRLDDFAVHLEPGALRLYAARAEPDFAAKRRHHHSRPAGQLFPFRAADLLPSRVTSRSAHHRGQLQFHHFGDRVSGHLLAWCAGATPSSSEPISGAKLWTCSIRPIPPARSPSPPRAPMFHGHGRQRAGLAAAGPGERFQHRHSEAAIQERAHIAEFFVGDEWKVSRPADAEPRHALHAQLPLDRGERPGRGFQPRTPRCSTFRIPPGNWSAAISGRAPAWLTGVGDTWVIRSGYGMVWFEQTGITTPFTLPQFPFDPDGGATIAGQHQPGFRAVQRPDRPGVRAQPNSGLGQGVFGVDRHIGSGYSQQWNFTVQKTFGRTSISRPAIWVRRTPVSAFPECEHQPAARRRTWPWVRRSRPRSPILITARFRLRRRWEQPTIAQQQLLRALSAIHHVALFRDNVGDSDIRSAAASLEKRFSHGLTFTAAYTFSKLHRRRLQRLLADHFPGPVLNSTGAADAYNRHLEKDLSSGDIPRVFSAGWVYEIPRLWKISGWQIAGLVRVQAGDAVAITRPPISIPAWASRSSGRTGSAIPTTTPAEAPPDGSTPPFHASAAVHHRQQLPQSGSRARASRTPT